MGSVVILDMMKKERDMDMDMIDFEYVVDNGVLLMCDEGNGGDGGDGGIEVYECGRKIYLFSYDWGGSLCGEERFDSIEEMKNEIDDVEWSI